MKEAGSLGVLVSEANESREDPARATKRAGTFSGSFQRHIETKYFDIESELLLIQK